MNTASYTSASMFPVKLMQSATIVAMVRAGVIPPFHAQLIPTNRCNANCSFCSCKNRDRSLELPFENACWILEQLHEMGCKAMTITGGGDPMVYPSINQLLALAKIFNIECGMVTNGIALHRLEDEGARACRWIRISCSSEADRLDLHRKSIARHRGIDWALSYVVGANVDRESLRRHIQFAADTPEITHIRVVSDLIDLDNAPSMLQLESELWRNCDTSKVIWQERQNFTAGTRECRIGFLKPVIGPDGKIYPCCGVQYAHSQMDMDMPDSMVMCDAKKMKQHWEHGVPFDGSKCSRCYYSHYNQSLEMLTGRVQHEHFV